MNFLLASTNTDFLLSEATKGFGASMAILIGSLVFVVFSMFAGLAFAEKTKSLVTLFGVLALFGAAILITGIVGLVQSGDLEGDTRSTIHEIENEYDITVYSDSLKYELMYLSDVQLEYNTTRELKGFTYMYDGQMYSTDLTIVYTAESRVGPTISLYSTGDQARELTAFDPANGFIASDDPEAAKSDKSDASEKELEPFMED